MTGWSEKVETDSFLWKEARGHNQREWLLCPPTHTVHSLIQPFLSGSLWNIKRCKSRRCDEHLKIDVKALQGGTDLNWFRAETSFVAPHQVFRLIFLGKHNAGEEQWHVTESIHSPVKEPRWTEINFKMQPCQTPGFGFHLNRVSRTDHKTMKEPGADVCEELNSYPSTLHQSSLTHWYHLINPYLNKTCSHSVTCTSSPCSRHLCCTHPSICGTYLKLSPLNRALSGRQTEWLWTEMQFTY